MRTVCNAVAIVLLSIAASAPQAQAQETARLLAKEQVVDRWATALGGRHNLQNVRTVHLHGTVEMAGRKGTYERWATSRGQIRTTVDLSGSFRQTIVFDGHEGWIEDTSGTVHELAGEVLRGTVSAAYEASNSFLFFGRLPGQVESMGEDPKQQAYVLRLLPERGSPVVVYLDPTTFLPQREETGVRVLSFFDWREFFGINFPGTVRQSYGDPKFDVLIRTEQVEVNGPVLTTLFARPGGAAVPIRFARGAPRAVIPAEVYGDHILVPVRVNGTGAAWFFLDSGGEMSVVSSSLAERAGLTAGGALRAQGTGGGSASLGLADRVVLTLPGIEVPASTVAIWDLSAILPMFGRSWDGLLGYDVISRLVVGVDYEHQQVTLYDPAAFEPDPHALTLAVTFSGNLPVVHAKIMLPGRAPLETECAIDSGADGFHLTTPFTKTNHVLESVPRTIAASSIGAGGEAKGVAGRLAGLQIGPYVLRGPIAVFSPQEEKGLLASSDIGALVGGEILRRFTVTFDYPHRRILLQPNRHFADPFTANESGLSLLAKGKDLRRFEVDEVEAGSPAEHAGLKAGDVLTIVNGHPARELDLDKIDRMLQPAGQAVPMSVERGGRTLKVIVELKERL